MPARVYRVSGNWKTEIVIVTFPMLLITKKTAGNSKIIALLLLIGFIVKIISFAANLFSR